MLEKVGEMENDPTSSRNTIEPPNEEDANNVDEIAELELEEEDEEYVETFLEDDSIPFENLEFSAINRQLDQLQSALDEIESRNADIHKELLEILYSNREVRKTISAEISGESSSSSASVDVPENKVPSSSTEKLLNDAETSVNSVLATSESISKNESLLDRANDLISNTTSVSELLHSVTQDIDKL